MISSPLWRRIQRRKRPLVPAEFRLSIDLFNAFNAWAARNPDIGRKPAVNARQSRWGTPQQHPASRHCAGESASTDATKRRLPPTRDRRAPGPARDGSRRHSTDLSLDLRQLGAVDTPVTHLIRLRWADYVETTNVIMRTTTRPTDGTLRTELYRVRRVKELAGRKRFIELECELEKALTTEPTAMSNAKRSSPKTLWRCIDPVSWGR